MSDLNINYNDGDEITISVTGDYFDINIERNMDYCDMNYYEPGFDVFAQINLKSKQGRELVNFFKEFEFDDE